jgi:hypothetical protein
MKPEHVTHLRMPTEMDHNLQSKQETKPRPNTFVDPLDESSQESFPASDSPSWTRVTGEKGSSTKSDSTNADAKTEGCATSFIMQERGELGGVCAEVQPDPQEEYVQPDKEKEAGGEG